MIIIIDAYNLLKQVIHSPWATEKQRQEFIAYMQRYANRKKHEIVLVFDGGPYGRPTSTKSGQVQVVYAGSYMSADDYIKEYLDKYKGYDLVLISSDNMLIAYARSLSIPSLKSMEFYNLIRQQPRALPSKKREESQVYKLYREGEQDNPELDKLMQANTGGAVHKEEASVSTAIHRQESQASKREKEIQKLLKKLQ